jgi:prevent-host-death family protein
MSIAPAHPEAPMTSVGVLEARDKLGQLLDRVEQGEEITITRDGREIARLIPAHGPQDQAESRVVIARIRARAEQSKLGHFDWAEWKSYRDEGRP